MYVLMTVLLLFQGVAGIFWDIEVQSNVTVHMSEEVTLPFSIFLNSTSPQHHVSAHSTDKDVATVIAQVLSRSTNFLNGTLNITGVFLGTAKVVLNLEEDEVTKDSEPVLSITVIRQERVIDTVFNASVAILVSILYINFGCAIDWSLCRETLKKPIGPAIGFCSQFFFMPLLSYAIGYFLFPNRPELQIGMFFTGISPSGGASNIWTVLLEGNLNLSVTITTICTLAAFGMMPFWLFTLGKYIFAKGQLTVPYTQIATFAFGLIIPLAIGYFIQRKLVKLARILIRIMKPCSAILILFIIIFATVTNLYLFKLFSWRILLAGLCLPWIGFAFGFAISVLCRQPKPDVIAIVVETGLQNTGVAIFLLRFTLDPPSDDLTTVVPVAAALMTPMPLILCYLIKLMIKCRRRSSLNVALERLQNLPESTVTPEPVTRVS